MFRVTRDQVTCPYCYTKHPFDSVEAISALVKNMPLLALVE